mmetsp:Transcript_11545/g.36508  ORF Transcript_11545/g.36508 Transcript_11545/m.36508 type:complete len:229 (-) Transcript_11545:1382-2068(-)
MAGPELPDLFKRLDGTLLKQGAEGRLFRATFLQRRAVVKQRFSKKYRHPVLDLKINKHRLNGEVRSMAKARKMGVVTPALLHVDHEEGCVYMEEVEGPVLKDVIAGGLVGGSELEALLGRVGEEIAKIHDGGLVHGDLTTSNLMLREADKRVVMIDFGLSFNSTIPEDKAVDLYVLERAFTSAHSKEGGAALFGHVMEGYRGASRFWSATHNKLAAVRMRGRKRVMIG